MGLRIIAGDFGRRRLRVPAGRDVRPTADRVREAVFAALGTRWSGVRVLDLFAGSGALGLEALSRGAAHATFVDHDRRAIATIEANVAALAVAQRCRIIARPVSDALRALGRETPRPRFDLAFLDPPYASDAVERTLPVLAASGLLTDDARLVVETDTSSPPSAERAGLVLERARPFGDTLVSVFRTAEAGRLLAAVPGRE